MAEVLEIKIGEVVDSSKLLIIRNIEAIPNRKIQINRKYKRFCLYILASNYNSNLRNFRF
ncbi:hypothetical protein GCM10008088_21910 [Mesonia mobilis]|uniref:Uncharacterized protein n=1 Tax=Mesonia mobilis TaxID=369791 RepID=A0ABQ3C0L6_9FLAO|nr:hypothetical protein GCM10008088_21910 [Mesonia mobilis]